ncbi:TPA: hypothetical protein ACFP4Y_002140 [Neisseria bacilliformis]|uniref:hypothetical protein n=1 Tax=Neisseria bacilliformis TaxID=267212 RepID=UPI000A783450|nr:hypothetical protein [Neisseria bacilliformis]
MWLCHARGLRPSEKHKETVPAYAGMAFLKARLWRSQNGIKGFQTACPNPARRQTRRRPQTASRSRTGFPAAKTAKRKWPFPAALHYNCACFHPQAV